MRMTQIKVQGLYGLHNYAISFDEVECLKIIHAPNGYGKTTLLKMIKYMMSGQMNELRAIPFKIFSIEFDQPIQIEVQKLDKALEYTYIEKGKKVTYTINENQQSVPDEIEHKLQGLQETMPIYLIDANRLWIERRDENQSSFFEPTVLEYAKELAEWMREVLAKSNYCSQELDCSFPNRLMKRLQSKEEKILSSEEIKVQLRELEEKRHFLERAGLYSNSEVKSIGSLETLDEPMRNVLSLYIEDSREKLKVFEGLATKINLLCNLINKRFSYKVMEVNMKDGFVFKVPTHESLKADKLSSGEQNELILMFKLLFKCPDQAMILMDEPEISLHIAWQQNFLEDMEAIAKLSHIRMMIATHSPDIINGRWELTSGLEEEVCDPI